MTGRYTRPRPALGGTLVLPCLAPSVTDIQAVPHHRTMNGRIGNTKKKKAPIDVDKHWKLRLEPFQADTKVPARPSDRSKQRNVTLAASLRILLLVPTRP